MIDLETRQTFVCRYVKSVIAKANSIVYKRTDNFLRIVLAKKQNT